MYAEFADRMTVVAQVPTHTPQEAIAELDYAVGELGMKAIMINGLVHRPIGDEPSSTAAGLPNWGSGSGERLDALGLDSAHDYDPFWARCIELGVAPASHTPGMGWGSRRSISSYNYNHIGSFGASMEAQCKALFMGGVTRRFPRIAFGLLEGGVGWACTLLADLVEEYWEQERAMAFELLCKEEQLDAEKLTKVIDRYVYTGEKPLPDPDIVQLITRPLRIAERGVTRRRVLEKVLHYVDTYIHGVAA